MRIGVLGVADIAQRRFLPAIAGIRDVELGGIAVAAPDERGDAKDNMVSEEYRNGKISKASELSALYGGKVYTSYKTMLSDPDIDMIYIPLPPSLHYCWIKEALKNGKHVLSEKPCTISYVQTSEIISVARDRELVLMENYAFCYHRQIQKIKDLISNGEIGDIRLIRAAFGFPIRKAEDFRYIKKRGGGALLDCAGYTIRLARELLGDDIDVVSANINSIDGYEVDMFGSLTMCNSKGIEAQLAFGMDNSYKCEMEAWGNKGCIKTNRIFTPPADFAPTLELQTAGTQTVRIEPDDQFVNSIMRGTECINDSVKREIEYNSALIQARLIEKTKESARRRVPIDVI